MVLQLYSLSRDLGTNQKRKKLQLVNESVGDLIKHYNFLSLQDFIGQTFVRDIA